MIGETSRGDTAPIDALIELLDRQVNFLLVQEDDESFLIQVDPFLRALHTDARVSGYLEDIKTELVQIAQFLEEIDAELVLELVELRQELVALWPGAEDAPEPPPDDTGSAERALAQLGYRGTLAFFDEHAAKEPPPFNAAARGGLAEELIHVLQAKSRDHLEQLEQAAPAAHSPEEQHAGPGRPPTENSAASTSDGPATDPLSSWRRRVGNVDRRYRHAQRWMRLRVKTSGGLALLKLEAVPEALNPTLRLRDPDEDSLQATSELLQWVGSEEYSLYKLVDGQSLSAADQSILRKRVGELRGATNRLHEDLRRRISTTRSRRALVERFKIRCEWHDRDRIVQVADDNSRSGGPEDRLTAEFARFLFDQGLSPLAKPMTGGLQPDLLDPGGSFYVEAKQYKRSARQAVIKGVAQILNTGGRLLGSAYAVDEAFCLVFRRSGPYYDLPATLHTEGFRVHLILVDVAPTTEAGRRQQHKPERILPEEFFAKTKRPV